MVGFFGIFTFVFPQESIAELAAFFFSLLCSCFNYLRHKRKGKPLLLFVLFHLFLVISFESRIVAL